MLFDIVTLVKSAGYLGVAGIVFAESGLLLGLILPGDSILFTAGLLASQGYLHIALLCTVTFVAAVLGDCVGYTTGKHFGPRIFHRENSLFLNKSHLERARTFYQKHGGKAVVLARFIPMIRSVAPILAGVGKMHYTHFLVYNIIGAGLWAVGVTLLGYWFGSALPNADTYLAPITITIITAALLPSAIHILRNKESRDQTIRIAKQILQKIGLFFSSRFR